MARIGAWIENQEQARRAVAHQHEVMRLATIRQLMAATLDEEELEQLVFDLDLLDWENIPAETKDGRIRYILNWCERHGVVELLVQQLQRLRPHAPWPVL